MPLRVLEVMLKENGFRLIRTGRHALFSDGTSKIILHKGTNDAPFAAARLRSQIRRALEKRLKGGEHGKAK